MTEQNRPDHQGLRIATIGVIGAVVGMLTFLLGLEKVGKVIIVLSWGTTMVGIVLNAAIVAEQRK